MDRKQRLNKMPAIDLLADFVLGGVARNINTSHNYWLYYLEGFPLLMKKSILRSFRPTPNFIRIAYLSVYCRPRGANSEQLFHMQPAASIYFCLDSSQLVLNPPFTLEDLLDCYNSTLSDLLSIHSPLIPIVFPCREPSVHLLPQSL